MLRHARAYQHTAASIVDMIEIDQSNKVERFEKDTILAFSTQRQYAICIPSSVKRRLFKQLVDKGKNQKNATVWIFAAGSFCC